MRRTIIARTAAARAGPAPHRQKLVDAARELAGARYAAIGVPDGDGGNILGKLGLSDRPQAALYAVREGLAGG